MNPNQKQKRTIDEKNFGEKSEKFWKKKKLKNFQVAAYE